MDLPGLGRLVDSPIIGHKIDLVCVFVALISLFFQKNDAYSYPTPVDYDGSILRWNITIDTPTVSYQLKADDETNLNAYSALVDQAAKLWTDVETSYITMSPYDPALFGESPHITITLAAQIDGGQVSSGYAMFDEYDQTKPIHCSIFVLVEPNLSFRSIGKTILHEMGHCLGLGHSLIPESIMSYHLSKNHFALDTDDQAAISRLYPMSGEKPQLPLGCAIGSFADPNADVWVWCVLFAPLLAVSMWDIGAKRTP